MKKKELAFLVLFPMAFAAAQTSSDSVTVTFRVHARPETVHFVPGEFNGWGPNSGGVIAPGALSQMLYDGSYSAWIKTYTFKIYDLVNRTLGDSVLQYKFNASGCNTCWFPDPLNVEQNAGDNSNSVLRLSRLFWFEFYGVASGQDYTGIIAGLVHANSDSVTSIRFETAETELDSLTVLDLTPSYNRTLRILKYSFAGPVPKSNYMRLVAYNNLGDSVVYKKIGYNVKTLAMPVDARHGVTLPRPLSGDSTTFRLLVPGKSLVMLRVAQLGQSPANVDPVVMHKNTGTDDWWRNVVLDPATTYEYFYEFEDGKRIQDPWGRWTGTNGTRFSTGSEGLAADDYVWGSTNYQRPPLNRLVIYELNVGELAGGYLGKSAGQATFQDLIQTLPHFNSLGVNALELMPINDYGIIGASGFSWGYDLSHHFALEPQYGTPRDFKELVDSAHARGIAVIVDVVFNHLNDPSPLWQMAPDESINPYFKYPPVAAQGLPTERRLNEDDWVFFKDMDNFTPETQEYVYQVLKMWIDEYHVDGFRYDYTQGIGWDVTNPTKGILGWANRIATEYGDSIYQIAEHLPESPALIYYSGLTGGWHDSFRDEIFDDARDDNTTLSQFEYFVLDLGAYGTNDVPATPATYGDRTQPVNATVTHDEQSLIYEMINFQGVDTLDALMRDKVYGAMMFTSLGIPMLWEGMEFGEPRGSQNGAERLSYRPVRWNLQSTESGKDHFRWYKTLVYQRRYNPALYDGLLRKLYRYDAQRTLVWGLEDTATSTMVMVVANLSGSDQTISNVPWLSAGTWYEMVYQTPFDVPVTPITTMNVPRYTARVYTNKTNAQLNIPVSVERDVTDATPSSFFLSANYPNPFNPSTSIQYQLPQATRVRMEIYNMIGELIAVLVDADQVAGFYIAHWNGTTLSGMPASSGMYLVRFRSNEVTETRKILLVR